MIDYNNMLYEDYKKLVDQIEKYTKYFLSKPPFLSIPPLEQISLRYYASIRNIGRKDLGIIANNKRFNKIIRISNMPPTEIKKDVIYGLAFLFSDSEEMADYIYDKQFKNTPKEYTSEVKKAILEEIEDIKRYERTKS